MPYQPRILIVDDSPTNVAVLEEILSDDFQLKIATCGEEALEVAPVFCPAVVLLDVIMPGIDGYETCRQLLAHPALHHTKIIMVSAQADVSERLQGYAAGAADYIAKPFDEEELLAKVRVYLRLKSVEEVDHLKSEVLSLLSHETGTPLNHIMVSLDLLALEDDMDPEIRSDLLGAAKDGALHLQHLFQQVWKLSQLKAGTYPIKLVPADLCRVVRDAVRYVAVQALRSNVQIEERLPHAALGLLGRMQMYEVVTALLDNAIRFSPPGGRVVIEVCRHNGDLYLTVTDQGEGIADDFLPFVFEAFANHGITRRADGPGLSLAIVWQIVQAHGGTIAVDSAPGKGSRFSLRFPALKADSAAAPEVVQPEAVQHHQTAAAQPAQPLGGRRVLFVDDEEALTFTVEQMLTSLGYDGVVTTSSIDALELFRRDPYAFDAVVTDQTMPDLTGEGLARELLGLRPDLPMIVCTGFSQGFTPDKAKALGVRDYLRKPLSKQDLGQSLERVLVGNGQGLVASRS